MKLRFLSLLSIATLLIFSACSEDRRQAAAAEVSEEGAQIVEAIGPDEYETKLPPPPPALISIDETMAAVGAAGGLTKLSVAAATPVIDKWIGTLSGNLLIDDSDLIVANLQKLKMLLSTAPINREQVSEVLEALARETEQAAEDADSREVATLAKVLDEAADLLD